jgi:AraC-like DNA-binding protein
VERDPRTGYLGHRVASSGAQSILAALATYGFRALRISAAIWEHEHDWFPIHVERSVSAFEAEHGRDEERGAYNVRMLANVMATAKAAVGEHAGFSDLFSPIVIDGRVAAILVVGPFATRRPTAASIADNWKWITSRHAHASDPELMRYVAATLSTLVLEPKHLAEFERMTTCFVELLAGTGHAEERVNEWERIRTDLEKLRFVDNAWDSVREMVDERTALGWTRPSRAYYLGRLGLTRSVEGALVGLAVDKRAEREPLERMLAEDALQRRVVHVASASGDAVAGRVGNHGVVLLVEGKGSDEKARVRLRELAQKVSTIARRELGLDLHWGAAINRTSPLDRTYRQALGAAESALVRGERLVFAGRVEGLRPGSLERLRRELGRITDEKPSVLTARFERYMEAVVARTGYRIDLVRAHLETGFERVAEPLIASGALGERGFDEMCEAVDRGASAARTTDDVLSAYRSAVADLVASLARPSDARHDRSIRRAIEFIGEHFTEKLSSAQVAKIAGLSIGYFSKLFHRREGKTFESYLADLRLGRAKQLLVGTELPVARVARLSGFGSSAYFCRAFRRDAGTTPLAYRAYKKSGGGAITA